jgi:hypothetical protein
VIAARNEAYVKMAAAAMTGSRPDMDENRKVAMR